ncbi:MAG: hypothetical protein WD875_05355 [Pirellulales bacterium]
MSDASDAAVDDFRWLTSDTAARWLRLAEELADEPLSGAERLRRELSAPRAAVVLEQAQLRRRARRKFSAAGRMFFTARGLEQATDETIATYKRRRFAAGGTIADLCCGIGGDLVALAARGPVVGVERDAATVVLAGANLAAVAAGDLKNARVECGDAEGFDVGQSVAWHIDPDRRPAGKRTTRAALHEPSDVAIDALFRKNPAAAVKLAPAAEISDRWAAEAELEWIGHDRQCQQLVAWFGDLTTQSGERRASVLRGGEVHSLIGSRGIAPATAPAVGRFVYEPHAAVLAADLWGDLAMRNELACIEPRIPYLTADAPVDDPLLARFEVLEVLPFRAWRLQAALRERRGGRLEIKKRGVDVDPAALRRELAVEGDEQLTVIVTRRARKTIAIIARRDVD